MLALPSDSVGQRGTAEPMGSLTLTLLRNVKNVSLLVVKANSAGLAHRSDAEQAGAALMLVHGRHMTPQLHMRCSCGRNGHVLRSPRPPFCQACSCPHNRSTRAGGLAIHALVEATATSGAMLRWVMQMLVPGKDTVFLGRCRAFDASGRLQSSAKRVLDTFRLQLSGAGFQYELRPCEEGNPGALASVCLPALLPL